MEDASPDVCVAYTDAVFSFLIRNDDVFGFSGAVFSLII